MDKAIVLLSGGLDSAVAFSWALKQGWSVCPLTFDYYLRPQREVEAVRALTATSSRSGPCISVDLPFLKEVEDLLAQGVGNAALEAAPLTYVPARNLIFYSLAAHYAEVEGARWIVGGHNGGDADTFPDAGSAFFGALNDLLGVSLLTASTAPVEIVNPLHGLSKAEVLRLGVELGVPLEVTWSCSLDGPAPCGRCHSCRERAQAFREAGLDDPLATRLSKSVA